MKTKEQLQAELIEMLEDWFAKGKPLGYDNGLTMINIYESEVRKLNEPNPDKAEFNIGDMFKSFRAGMERGSDVAIAVINKNDKLIKADSLNEFMKKYYPNVYNTI